MYFMASYRYRGAQQMNIEWPNQAHLIYLIRSLTMALFITFFKLTFWALIEVLNFFEYFFFYFCLFKNFSTEFAIITIKSWFFSIHEYKVL